MGLATAADAVSKPAWETSRATSPETAEELRALQERVKQVAKKTTPCTVGILIGQGAGSGVIVSEDGLVLTAAHVIGKPRQTCIMVLSDGSTVKGETLGVNARADSGMLRITEKPPKDASWPGAKEGKWPFVEVGKSTDLKVSQWLVSLGHPGGPKQERPPPVRVGRLRSQSMSKTEPVISTDCTLVGGDSGGPLFDLDGKVVGIHSRIGLFLEQNMHIPTDKFKDEWTRLARGDSVGRKSDAELGLTLETKAGKATVATVDEDGPAWKADMDEGDVIVKFNGFPVASASDLADILSSYSSGDKVKIEGLRDKVPFTAELKLRKIPGKAIRKN